MTKKLSIVVPAYNAERTLPKTLAACLAQSVPCEVIVADDGSTDGTPAAAARFPVKYLRQENKGPAAARNLGWRAAAGEIILFTDSDCVPEKDWALKLSSLLGEEGASAAGGTYALMNPESLTASCIHYEIQYRHSTLPETVRYLGSFSLAVPRVVLERLGGFDESFTTACGEDTDLTYRIAALGAPLRFSRDVKTGHYFPSGTRRFLRQQFWRGYWIMKLLAMHPGKLGNDGYSKPSDALQPPLFAAIAVSAPLCFFPAFCKFWLAANLAAFLLNLPAALYAVQASGRPALAYTAVLLYLRGFFWAAGCAAGALKFWRKK
jgi:glycosyltransferase involved in cell wall biosynthesis